MLEKRNRNVGRTSESKKTSMKQFSIDGKPKLLQRSITTKVNVNASQRGTIWKRANDQVAIV